MGFKPLRPLQASFNENAFEAEMKAIFVRLYGEHISTQDEEINTFGMPHLGTATMLHRHIKADGLAVINGGDTEKIRFLFKAWKYQNPRRGLHFLRTYLRVLWGNAAEVQQMYQKKSHPYPTYLRSLREIEILGHSTRDYYLTSRIRIDIDAGDTLRENLRAAISSTLPAKYVMDMRVAKFSSITSSTGMLCRAYSIARLSGSFDVASAQPVFTGLSANAGLASRGYSVLRLSGSVTN